MGESTKMVHIRMPVSLIKEMDDLLKKPSRASSRSRFIIDAVTSSLQKENYLEAVKGLAGMLAKEEVPHWKNEEGR